MAPPTRKVSARDVSKLFAKLGHCELQWTTLTWLMCDFYNVIASEAKRAIGEAVDRELIVHDRGWLYLPKNVRK